MDHHSPSPSMFLGGGMTSSSGGGASSSMAGTSSSFMGMGVGQNQQMQHSQQQHHSQHDEPELCLVCNDVATGYHYGTPSCNGCKTFFRRTVMKKQVFQCQYDGNCPVDKSVRCACRHCRFKKCLAVGMNKDAIQQNRDPIGYTKRTRRYPLVKHHHQVLLGAGSGGDFGTSEAGTSGHSSPFAAGASIASTPFPNAGPQSSFMHGAGPSSSSFASTSSSAGTSSFMNSLSGGTQQHFGRSGPTPSSSSSRSSHSQQSQQLQQQQSPVTAEQIQEDMLLQRLIGVENVLVTIRNSKVNVQKSLNDLVMNRSIFEDPQMIKQMTMESFQMPNVLRRAEQEDYLYWHERDWYIMIEWAKMLPVYQQLSISDKLALLRHSAITYPSLIQCFYTPDVGPDTIVFPNGAFFDRTLDPNKPTGFQRKNFKMLDNLLNPIRKMQIDQNEFSGAKGIFFLNPGNFDDVGDSDADDLSPEAKSQIAVARSAITNALYRYMVQKRGTEDAADKFGKLLLLGTAIATMSCEMKEAVVVADFFDQIRFSGFARQLLLAKDEDDIGHQPMTQLPPQNQPMTQLTLQNQAMTQLPPQNQPMTQLPPQNQTQPPQNVQTTTVANMMPIQNGLIQNGGGHHHQPPQQFFNGNFPQINQQPMMNPMMAPMMNTLTSPAPTMMMNSMMNYSAGHISNGIGHQMTMHHQHHQQQSMQHNPTTTAATMAMLNGLNAQMQQIQQQQHILMGQFGSGDGNGNNNNKMAINVGQFGEGQITQNQQQLQLEAPKTTPAAIEGPKDSTVEEQKDLNENDEIEEEEEDGQEQSQMQIQKLQQQLMEEKKQQHREMMGQTQLGPDSVHQTILPPQDQQPPFTPAMYNSEPQPPSAQSQQSFNNTSPPSLINLT